MPANLSFWLPLYKVAERERSDSESARAQQMDENAAQLHAAQEKARVAQLHKEEEELQKELERLNETQLKEAETKQKIMDAERRNREKVPASLLLLLFMPGW